MTAKGESETFEADHQNVKPVSRRKVIGFRIFIVILTVAILVTIGVLVGYYSNLDHGNEQETAQSPLSSTTGLPLSTAPPFEGYYVGVARTDVTGPVVQVNMMGYAHPEQIATGLHTRLYSRAFVIANKANTSRVAFVSFDGGMTSQLIKLEVVKRLQEKHGDLFNERNVVISGTHTHSGPAGFFQYLLFEVTSFGHINQSTEAFIKGITTSIELANSNLQEATIKTGSSNVDNGNINRSPTSYLLNPEEERNKYCKDTEQEQVVMRFDTLKGEPLGMIAWYPVHPTNMNFTNTLINSDNKGRASALFERSKKKPEETIPGTESFVAAFAQSNQGDVSPRTNGPICIDTGEECDAKASTCDGRSQTCVAFGPGKDMFDSTDILAKRQLAAAQEAYQSAEEVLEGPIHWVHQYVNMSEATVTLDDGSTASTCKAGLGYSFAAGCTDGAGALGFTQGTTRGDLFWNAVRDFLVQYICTVPPPDDYYACHKPKPVLLPTGYMDKPYDWHPDVVSIQLLRIGQLIIAAVPGEYSTMAGRRLREMIAKEAVSLGMPANTKVVIAGLSNVYTHYITTPEEYGAQRYEAASTIYGPNTFHVYQQKYKNLVAPLVDLADNEESGLQPQIDPRYSRFVTTPAPDSVPAGTNFGDVIDDVNTTYSVGEVVRVKFYGANPRHDMKLGSTYLEVQQIIDGKWRTVYTDADWSTKFKWEEKNVTTPLADITMFTPLFDLVAETTGIRFDLEQAMLLHNEGQFLDDVEDSDKDVITKTSGNRFLDQLRQKGIVYPEPRRSVMKSTAIESYVTIEWQIPSDQISGTYRIIYFGDHLSDNGQITSFQGQSLDFSVF